MDVTVEIVPQQDKKFENNATYSGQKPVQMGSRKSHTPNALFKR